MERSATQILKGLAIIFVFLYHVQLTLFGGIFLAEKGGGLSVWTEKISGYLTYRPDLFWGFFLSLGFIGVQVFLILSGYGLTKKYLAEQSFSFRSWLRQIWKLLLPYFIALPVTHVINWALSHLLVLSGRIEAVPPFFGIYRPEQYLESLIVPSRWFTNELALNFVGTWWFVGMILQFYLLLPLLIWLLRKLKPWRFLLLALLITLVYRALAVELSDHSPIGINMAKPLAFINFPARLAEFALGMYFATRKDLHLFKGQFLVGLFLSIFGVVIASYNWGMVFSDPLIGIGLLLCFEGALKVIKGLAAKVLSLLGEYSYYIYLYHEPALNIILRVLIPLPL